MLVNDERKERENVMKPHDDVNLLQMKEQPIAIKFNPSIWFKVALAKRFAIPNRFVCVCVLSFNHE